MPAARTAIRTSPAPTAGSGRSWTWRTSGPPVPVSTTARIGQGYSTCSDQAEQGRRERGVLCTRATEDAAMRRSEQVDGAADGETFESEDLLDRLRPHRSVGGEGHHGLVPALLGADRGGDDVDPLFAEEGPDPPDHPRPVGVTEDGDVLGERQVEALAPDRDQVRLVAGTDAGARHLDLLVAGTDPDGDQLGEVLGAGVVGLD